MTQTNVHQHGVPVGVQAFGFFESRSGPLRLPPTTYATIPILVLIFDVLCLSYLTQVVAFATDLRVGH
jgi:hypothetical protein